MRSGGVVPHTRTVVVVGGVLVVLFLLLGALVLLLAGGLAERFGPGAVFVTTTVAAVLSWIAAGWFGSTRLRAAGEGRARAGVSAAAGGALGYLLGPGLVAAAGLLLSGPGLGAFLVGPLLGAVLAAGVAGLAAVVAPHAPAPAPYVGR